MTKKYLKNFPQENLHLLQHLLQKERSHLRPLNLVQREVTLVLLLETIRRKKSAKQYMIFVIAQEEKVLT
jgi:hypothetical protein